MMPVMLWFLLDFSYENEWRQEQAMLRGSAAALWQSCAGEGLVPSRGADKLLCR